MFNNSCCWTICATIIHHRSGITKRHFWQPRSSSQLKLTKTNFSGRAPRKGKKLELLMKPSIIRTPSSAAVAYHISINKLQTFRCRSVWMCVSIIFGSLCVFAYQFYKTKCSFPQSCECCLRWFSTFHKTQYCMILILKLYYFCLTAQACCSCPFISSGLKLNVHHAAACVKNLLSKTSCC